MFRWSEGGGCLPAGRQGGWKMEGGGRELSV